jgi:ArsR family transcriptional regulator
MLIVNPEMGCTQSRTRNRELDCMPANGLNALVNKHSRNNSDDSISYSTGVKIRSGAHTAIHRLHPMTDTEPSPESPEADRSALDTVGDSTTPDQFDSTEHTNSYQNDPPIDESMSQTNNRLRRYLADELGDCRDEDLEQRMGELEALFGETNQQPIDADINAMAALANDTRYTIMRVLAASQEEMCVCEFNVFLDVSDSAVSHALSELTDAGLLTRRKDGKWRKYRATSRAIALIAALDGTKSHQ